MKTIHKAFACLVIVFLGIAYCAWTQEVRSIGTEQNLVYGKASGQNLILNIAYPSNGNGPFPSLVYIYCAWGWYPGFDRNTYNVAIEKAAEKGYVAVSIDFRRLNVMQDGHSRFPFPAQIEDAKAAVRWLRANAVKYHVNPDRIGALGWSGGANMALMLGLTDAKDGLEGSSGNEGFSSKVQAVVSVGGVVDMEMFYREAKESYSAYVPMIENMMQGSPEERQSNFEAASPLTYVRKDSPPVLTLHGDADKNVWPEQAEALGNKMKEVGAFNKLMVVPGGVHQDFIFSYEKDIFDFLDKALKRNKL